MHAARIAVLFSDVCSESYRPTRSQAGIGPLCQPTGGRHISCPPNPAPSLGGSLQVRETAVAWVGCKGCRFFPAVERPCREDILQGERRRGRGVPERWAGLAGAALLLGMPAPTPQHPLLDSNLNARTRVKVAPLGGAAVAAPLKAPVASAVSRVGASAAGMRSGRLLDVRCCLMPITAVARTTFSLPAFRPDTAHSMDVQSFVTQLLGASLRHTLMV